MSLLLFPPELTLESEYATPQEFALQFWSPQKTSNTSAIVGILGMFVNTKGGAEGGIQSAIQRLLVELALASNCPTAVKVLVRGFVSLLFSAV